MIKRYYMLVVIVGTLCLGLFLQNKQEMGVNLLQNSDFEEGIGYVPSHWFFGTYASAQNMSWDKSVSYQGQASVSVVNHDRYNKRPISWRQNIMDFPVNRELILSGYVKTEKVSSDSVVAISIRAEDAAGGLVACANTYDAYQIVGTHDWTEVKAGVAIPLEAEEIEVAAFLSGTGHVWFDDIQLIVGKEADASSFSPFQGLSGPGIASAIGRFQIIAEQNVETTRIAFPIPLAFEDQVPILFEIYSQPADAVREVVIKKRDEYNWVAELTFNSLRENDTVNLEWVSYVLIRDHDYSQMSDVEIPKKEELPDQVCCWLASTVSVQADHPEIQEKAKEIRGNSTNVIEIAQKTSKFLRTIKLGDYYALDAVTALHEGGSCVSYANLAAALLRANGIPTRILAVIPAYASVLQTHYIVEFFIPEYGWVRFESTHCRIPWKPYNDVVVAVVKPEDENRSFQQPRWFARGVPYLSVLEKLDSHNVRWRGTVAPEKNCNHAGRAIRVFGNGGSEHFNLPCEAWNIFSSKTEDLMEEAFRLTWNIWKGYLRLKSENREIPQEILIAQKAAVDSTSLEEYTKIMRGGQEHVKRTSRLEESASLVI
jgi:transglutaminase-like putative cysteine protease